MRRVMELIEKTGLPRGVVNLVNGGRAVVDALCDHPQVRAISFVGSTPVAKHVYARAAASGKRMQCQGGAKNHVIVLPDADMELATQIISDSAFGCAGQRCLAVSVAVTVGDAQKSFRDSISHAASSLRVGNGLERRQPDGSGDQRGEQAARGVVDCRRDCRGSQTGRGRAQCKDSESGVGKFREAHGARWLAIVEPTDTHGNFRAGVEPGACRAPSTRPWSFCTAARTATRRRSLPPADRQRGNFATKRRAGNIGINIGVAAPMAYFPFSGWKDSFFGILHGQGRDAVEFYTESKVVIERWSRQETRKF